MRGSRRAPLHPHPSPLPARARERRGPASVSALLIAALLGVLPGTPALAAEKVKIGYPSLSLSELPIHVAATKGFFRDEGLEVELLQARSNVLLSALVAGEIPFITSLGSTIRAALRGLPVKVIAGITNNNPDFLMTRPEVKRVGDLRGKVLAVNSHGATSHQRLNLILRDAGLDPNKDVKVVAVGDAGVRLEQLRLGQIDGTVVTPPHNFFAERRGLVALASSKAIQELPAVGLSTSEQILREKPDLAKRVIRGMLKGMRYIKESPDETVQMIMQWLALDREIAQKSYALMLPNYAQDGRIAPAGLEATIRLDGSDPVLVSKVADFALLSEVLKGF